MPGLRIAVVGAGVAGLTAALALQRDGHEVVIYERAPELRASGFGLNLWSNATTLLHGLGVEIPGEPFDHVSFRAGGSERAVMKVGPRHGQPHMNAERGALLRAIHDRLAPGTIRYDAAVSALADLDADGADLVVAADGIGSLLRPDLSSSAPLGKPWSVWQAVIPDGGELIEPGGGAVVVGRSRFVGIWRQPRGELCWFVEDPTVAVGTAPAEVLQRACDDEDPLVAAVARRTPVERFGEWLARDRRPTRRAITERVIAIGDAAHPMWPCIGQGACTSIEDGVALAHALRGRSVAQAASRYRRARLLTVQTRVATAHFACTTRRPSPVATAVAVTPIGRPFAFGAGKWMAFINTPNRRLVREMDAPLTGTSAGR